MDLTFGIFPAKMNSPILVDDSSDEEEAAAPVEAVSALSQISRFAFGGGGALTFKRKTPTTTTQRSLQQQQQQKAAPTAPAVIATITEDSNEEIDVVLASGDPEKRQDSQQVATSDTNDIREIKKAGKDASVMLAVPPESEAVLNESNTQAQALPISEAISTNETTTHGKAQSQEAPKVDENYWDLATIQSKSKIKAIDRSDVHRICSGQVSSHIIADSRNHSCQGCAVAVNRCQRVA